MKASNTQTRAWIGLLLAFAAGCASTHPSAPLEGGRADEALPNQGAPLWIEPGRPDLGTWVSTAIERQAGLNGESPEYSFTIGSDGNVHYQGTANTRVSGDRVFELGKVATRNIGLLSRPFLEMQADSDVYQYPMAHTPVTVVTVVTSTTRRVIRCFVLDWYDIRFMQEEPVMPHYVREFWALFSSSLDAIEEVSGVRDLVGVKDRSDP